MAQTLNPYLNFDGNAREAMEFYQSVLGGELRGMTQALAESREEVVQRMVEEAEGKGANAVVAMRFDTSEMGGTWTEICAYGTAARIKRR